MKKEETNFGVQLGGTVNSVDMLEERLRRTMSTLQTLRSELAITQRAMLEFNVTSHQTSRSHQTVISCLASRLSKEPKSAQVLANAIGKELPTVRATLADMVHRGLAYRVGPNSYTNAPIEHSAASISPN